MKSISSSPYAVFKAKEWNYIASQNNLFSYDRYSKFKKKYKNVSSQLIANGNLSKKNIEPKLVQLSFA